MIKCTNCGTELIDGSKFCMECGTPVPQVIKCINCGKELPLNSKFCLECGTPVNQNQSPASMINIGAKSVIAGDVINTTNITNNLVHQNDKCSCCGKTMVGNDYFTCSVCGTPVCKDCYIPEKKKCKNCDTIERSKYKIQNIKIVSNDGSSFYSSIQEAIEDSDSGHVIKIKPGLYEQCFDIEKNISLEAFDENNPPQIKLDSKHNIGITSDCKISNINFSSGNYIFYILSGTTEITNCNISEVGTTAIYTKRNSKIKITNCSFRNISGKSFMISEDSSLYADRIKLSECAPFFFESTRESSISNFEINNFKSEVFNILESSSINLTNGKISQINTDKALITQKKNSTLSFENVVFEKLTVQNIIDATKDDGSKTANFNQCKIHDCTVSNNIFYMIYNNFQKSTVNLYDCEISNNRIGNSISYSQTCNFENVKIFQNTSDHEAIVFYKGKLNNLLVTENHFQSFLSIKDDSPATVELSNLQIENNDFTLQIFDINLEKTSNASFSGLKILKNHLMDSGLKLKMEYPSSISFENMLVTQNDFNSSIFEIGPYRNAETINSSNNIKLHHIDLEENQLNSSCFIIKGYNHINLSNIKMKNNKGLYGFILETTDACIEGDEISIRGNRADIELDSAVIFIGKTTTGKIKLNLSWNNKGYISLINNNSIYKDKETKLSIDVNNDPPSVWEDINIFS
ncbi:MAG: zinc-ribbon domain-containing protein [Treponema sp.]|nr:zinc-ribbon domain-containing protein [Treponema sp.]